MSAALLAAKGSVEFVPSKASGVRVPLEAMVTLLHVEKVKARWRSKGTEGKGKGGGGRRHGRKEGRRNNTISRESPYIKHFMDEPV